MVMTWRWRWWWIALTALTSAMETVKAEASDEWCLREVRKGLEGPLVNWTASNFAVPCSGFTSYLQGATCNNGRIYKLTLTNLSLKGTLSPNIANCTNLQSLDLSHNLIAGSIPSELRFLVNLAVLNLSSNQLSGVIPPEIAMCVYLNIIDLHSNLLSGQIPQNFVVLRRLSALDLSDNRLSGPIPPALSNRSVAGNLPRLNASSFRGNHGLYGYPLPPLRQRGLSVVAIVGIGLGSGFASLVLSFAAVCFWLRVSERKTSAEEGKITHLMPDY